MIPVEGHPAGTIVVTCGELSRYSDFTHSLLRLRVPMGTHLLMSQGVNIPGNINKGIRALVGEWLWVMGDDHTFETDCLLRLLAHGKDVVMPHVTVRKPPFFSLVYKTENAPGHYQVWQQEDLPAGGLVEVAGGPGAGMLVRKHVLDAVGDPWYENGMTGRAETGHDLYFCTKARKHGFTCWVDLDTPMGHISNFTVFPQYTNRGWAPALDLDNDCVITLHREPAQ